jgi:hypothetical protein
MRIPLLLAFLVAPLCTPSSAVAQQAPVVASSWHYWVSAGGGLAYVKDERGILGDNGSALSAAATVQHGAMVASARWVRSSSSLEGAWDVGLLAGVGTSAAIPVRGSVAAGIGRIESRFGVADVTIPVEVQFSWRVAGNVGLGVYGFGSFSSPSGFYGATLAVQVGHW